MSKRGGETCEHCGLAYDDMRTGHTYQSIYEMLWSGNEDSSTWVYKRRLTILGKWHQIKLEMWDDHVEMCRREAEWEEQQRAACNIQHPSTIPPAFLGSETTQTRDDCNDEVPF